MTEHTNNAPVKIRPHSASTSSRGRHTQNRTTLLWPAGTEDSVPCIPRVRSEKQTNLGLRECEESAERFQEHGASDGYPKLGAKGSDGFVERPQTGRRIVETVHLTRGLLAASDAVRKVAKRVSVDHSSNLLPVLRQRCPRDCFARVAIKAMGVMLSGGRAPEIRAIARLA